VEKQGGYVTAEQTKRLHAIFGMVSSAHTALVLLADELSAQDFADLQESHDRLIEAEIALCTQLIKPFKT
jgi:hypothetical protein